jgi:hypothetical protein
VFTFCYGTGRPHPYTPVFAMISAAGGVITGKSYNPRDYSLYVGSATLCVIAWGGR